VKQCADLGMEQGLEQVVMEESGWSKGWSNGRVRDGLGDGAVGGGGVWVEQRASSEFGMELR
jgi:hypothetical protein